MKKPVRVFRLHCWRETRGADLHSSELQSSQKVHLRSFLIESH